MKIKRGDKVLLKSYDICRAIFDKYRQGDDDFLYIVPSVNYNIKVIMNSNKYITISKVDHKRGHFRIEENPYIYSIYWIEDILPMSAYNIGAKFKRMGI